MGDPSSNPSPAASEVPPSDAGGRPGLPTVLATLVLAASMTVTWRLWEGARADAEQRLRASFEFRVRDAGARVSQRMVAYEQVLRGAAGLFAAPERVERRQFRDYVASLRLEENYPGLQGVGFAPIVPAALKGAHTTAVRREGLPEYSIWPDGQRDPYSPVIYLEPFAGLNLRVLGYDMLSERVRRTALERARDSGKAALTGKVTLIYERGTNAQAGTLMYVPVYRNGLPGGTVTERRANLAGWVYSAFRMNDLMRGIFGERDSDLDIELFDGEQATAATLLYSGDGIPLSNPRARFQAELPLHVASQRWTMKLNAMQGFEASSGSDRPRLIAMAGAITSVLLTLLVWLLARGRARALYASRELDRDLAELKKAEAALLRSEQQLALAQEVSHIGNWTFEPATGKFTWSAELYRIHGLDPRTAPSRDLLLRHIHPEDRPVQEAIGRALEEGSAFELEHRIVGGDGQSRIVHARAQVVVDRCGPPSRMIGTVQDVTGRKEMEAKLSHAERMASLGTLVGGVGHEINNPLSYVLGNLRFLSASLEDVENVVPPHWLAEARRSMGEALEGGERIQRIVKDLSAFTRPVSESGPVDVHQILDLAINIASSQISHRANLVKDYLEVPRVQGDASRLGQVVLNLLVNAAQAIPQGQPTRNEVRVATRTHADRVVIEVSDTGCGIPPEIRKHLFEPFLTTKPVGEGTGLGLSICHGIVTSLGGEIAVESEVGRGSTFRVSIPVNRPTSPARPETPAVGRGPDVGRTAAGESSRYG